MVDSPPEKRNVELETGNFEFGFGDSTKECLNTEISHDVADAGKFNLPLKCRNTDLERRCSTNMINQSGDAPMVYSPPKRRKVDKDGFLTPATPEPPKFNFNSDTNLHRFQEDQSTDEISDISSKTSEETAACNEAQQKESSSPDSKQNTSKSVGEVVQELGQEAKMMHLHWAQMLSQSENVEHFMLTRLNQILTEAKSLENNLKQQKAELRGRLQELLKTMET